MRYFLFLGILLYMFISTTVAAKIGILQVGTYSSFILFVLFVSNIITDVNQALIKRFKLEFRIMFVGIIIVFFKIFIGQSNQINQVLFFVLMPMILSVLVGFQNKENRKIIRYLVLIFFITECLLAIYERLFFVNVFPYMDSNAEYYLEDWAFRSSGFLGHPLSNALCVSTMMGFIITSSMKLQTKLVLVILGFIALLCFNARASILVWLFLLLIYIWRVLKDKKTKKIVSFLFLFFFVISGYLIFKAVNDYGLGGRITNSKINDGSAQTRFEVFDAFSYISDSDFWCGNGENYLPIMYKLGAGGVENSYIVLIINYGLPLSIILLFLYYLFINRFFKQYRLLDKFVIFCSFILVGSTNNGLVNSAPWTFFILSVYCFPFFKKENLKRYSVRNKVVNEKMLIKRDNFPQ
ncbi:O-antigen ligase family protein [Flavobacterium sp. LHD-80]|uniref:O-antigen ligase family protein n=1 Tax=Flavobacterium sp. LHD-80 TaxID=3071411 RepID=UPI0027E07BCE|nr:O-antigen ligase family protein [Flavobacterium sp. LHD-80]MDQ6471033.1 O-antigen ligase family protein [Flavobacterium sp. LHD-80]